MLFDVKRSCTRFRLHGTPDEYKNHKDEDDGASLIPLTQEGKELRRRIRTALGLRKEKPASDSDDPTSIDEDSTLTDGDLTSTDGDSNT